MERDTLRVLICGSRLSFPVFKDIERAITSSKFRLDEIVTSTGQGVDYIVSEYARAYEIPIKEFFADWLRRGEKAIEMRNREMTDYADCVIAFDNSKDSEDIVKLMGIQEKPIYRYHY